MGERGKAVVGFAYAAGATSILANVLLFAFFAVRASHPEVGASLGPANALVGSLGPAFMVAGVLLVSAWLAERRLCLIARVLGLSALAVLTVCGSLLVLEVPAFEVQALIAVAAWMVLCLLLSLVNRWLRSPALLAWLDSERCWHPGRQRDRRARILIALDVVTAALGLWRRGSSRRDRHPGLVLATGTAPGVMTFPTKKEQRRT